MIGETIRYYRKEKRMTLKQLGEKVGYAENSVWQWEKNLREPDIATLLRLSEALTISITELLGGLQSMNNVEKLNEIEKEITKHLTKYDPELPNWMIEEFTTFTLRAISWCKENGYRYERSGGRELLFLPTTDQSGNEVTGILLEVPEASHYETLEKHQTEPYAYLSIGNHDDGFSVFENISPSTFSLEESLRNLQTQGISLIQQEQLNN